MFDKEGEVLVVEFWQGFEAEHASIVIVRGQTIQHQRGLQPRRHSLPLVQSPCKRLAHRLGQVLQHRTLAGADVHHGGHAGFEGHVSQFGLEWARG